MRKTIIKLLITTVLVCSIVTTFLVIPAFAGTASVYLSSPSATVGSNVSISVSITGNVAYYNISLSYDSSYLRYVSSSSTSDFSNISDYGSGVRLIGNCNSGEANHSCTITFQTLNAGTTNVSASITEIVDGNRTVVENASANSSTVTITNPPTASSDATLKNMSISPGSLSPSFSSNTTSYSATVSSSTTQLNVYAETTDDNATVSVSNRNLSVGSNTVKVIVTAEDGTTKTYTITVTRPAGTTAPPTTGGNTGGNTGSGNTTDNTPETDVPEAPTEAYIALEDGTILEVAETIDEEKIPAGFVLTETTIDGFTVDAIKYSENSYPAVWLIGDDNAPEGFYFIKEDGLGYPMITLSHPEDGIILTDITAYDAPDGYVLGKFNIGETEYDAFVKDDGKDPDHCLIYGINATGETILYCYDPADGTFQKYGIASSVEIKEVEVEVVKEVEVEVIKEVEVPAEPEELTLATLLKDKLIFWSLIGIGVVIIILIALCIMLAIMYSRKSKACHLMASKRSFNTEPLPTIEE